MIRNLNNNDNYIAIHQGYSPAQHQFSPGALSAGQMRYNPNSYEVEVYNGLSWHALGSTVAVNLSETARRTLEWAENKMREEERLKDLIARHPGLKELNDKFEMMKVLCQEEEKHK